MTDNEIIKSLEWCTNPKVGEKCPRAKFVEVCNDGCVHILMEQALDLIDRQKVEIERLEEENTIVKEALEHEINGHLRNIFELRDKLARVKSEAIEEFLDKFDKRCLDGGIYPGVIRNLLDIVKNEMVGD